MADMVRMTHSQLGDGGPVSRRAFETIWSNKGWSIVEEESSTAPKRRRAKKGEVTDNG